VNKKAGRKQSSHFFHLIINAIKEAIYPWPKKQRTP
jgi:hypothetical protein